MPTTTRTPADNAQAIASLRGKVARMERDPRTAELRRLVRTARATAKRVRAEVDAYYRPIFDSFEFLHMETGERITDPARLYLCQQEELCAAYYAACDVANREHGHDLPAGHCPALVAEDEARKAERAFLEHCGDACGIDFRGFVHPDLWASALNVFMDPA